MKPSSWTAQLSLWREIISEIHEGTERASILEIFLELGSSASTHEASSSINNLTDSSVGQILEVVHDDQSQPRSRRVGLMDLPIEVFDKILDQIHRLPNHGLYEKRTLGEVKITGPGDMTPYYTYLYRDSPILNHVQNFSLTSREIYQYCQPRLWRKLIFPTSSPAPIDLWTKGILCKQGTHVQSLALTLSENCCKPLGEFIEHDSFYDNLDIDPTRERKQISPKNVKDLINMCPNLSTLEMSYDYEEPNDDKGRTEDFLLDLVPLISNLKHLQEFIFVDTNRGTILYEFPSKVIGILPLLESLIICVPTHTVSGSQKLLDSSFGFNLSKLRYLSRLSLGYVDVIDESWCLYEWPKTITNIEFLCCRGLLPSLAHQVIHHIAPYLTDLSLDFPYKDDGDDWEFEPNWNPQSHLSFPYLTNLRLCTRNAHFLVSFQNCKSLRRVEFSCRTLEHCRVPRGILLEGNWPQLEKLHVNADGVEIIGVNLREVEDELLSLEQCCKEINLKVIITRFTRKFVWGNNIA
ncbi:uncharacterized protein MELLADRAFT_108463 [Melampsora larici-populina 98AG31]|uniref:F-box domain-containing protein n=1 Tax=Melampsora larici-populina (strain 98AG31 / pathotype 3-4-7) TaxID=747676 RepID=F4RT64_MELLP|nr:uncharacterized protein MELLADRAFT_108463 [Melampsora larici-populina 98AG31]EGG04451.1 hypothetical protein MELLADRAFT_108463 [Melampsora larici-populina 98AG31]